jgi:hypothetical protein
VYAQRSQLHWDLPLIGWRDILAAMYKLPRRRYRDHLDFAYLTPVVALRFVLAHPEIDTAIVGTANPAHTKANIASSDRSPRLGPLGRGRGDCLCSLTWN